MEVSIIKFCAFLLIFSNTLHFGYTAPPIKSQARSLTVNHTEDVKWFFRGVNKIAATLEQFLPNITTNDIQTRSFSETTKITFLMGLRHLLVGIQEISMTFEQNFSTDHIKQLHQLKNVTNFVTEVLSAIRMWFTQLRAVFLHLVHLYNRYIPEVLFGKCIGNYLITTYPDRSYYEYPFIFLSEIYTSIASRIYNNTAVEISTESVIADNDMNEQQNEILHSDSEEPQTSSSLGKKSSPESAESFFDFGLVLNENKDTVIESAANKQSWQICLKLYTAESLSRSLRSYFLGL